MPTKFRPTHCIPHLFLADISVGRNTTVCWCILGNQQSSVQPQPAGISITSRAHKQTKVTLKIERLWRAKACPCLPAVHVHQPGHLDPDGLHTPLRGTPSLGKVEGQPNKPTRCAPPSGRTAGNSDPEWRPPRFPSISTNAFRTPAGRSGAARTSSTSHVAAASHARGPVRASATCRAGRGG